MKTILFGANGFIGNSLEANVRIARNEVDLLDFESIVKVLKKYRPTHVINAAAKHGSFKEMQENHSRFLQTNIMIDSNILEAARLCGVEKVTILSSISALPESTETLSEINLSKGSVADSNFGYNFSKYTSTQLVKAYQLDGYSGFHSLLLGNIYGYNSKFDKNSNVIATIIRKMHASKIGNTNLELYGNGRDSRCFTHLSDVNRIIQKLAVHPRPLTEPLIISNSTVHSISDIATAIKKSMNFEGEIIFLDKITKNFTEKKVNNSNLMNLIGEFEFLSLEKGIEITVLQYLANHDSQSGKSAN